MKYYIIKTFLNQAKGNYKDLPSNEKIMGSQIQSPKDLTGYFIPLQIVKANEKIKDFYSPFSGLSARTIVSTRVKELLEQYRKKSIVFYHCPIKRGSKIHENYWISHQVLFDDEQVDFRLMEFDLIKRNLISQEGERPRRYDIEERKIKFKTLEEWRKFKKENLTPMDELHHNGIQIKQTCLVPILCFSEIPVFDLVISEELKNEIQTKGYSDGVEFQPIEMTLNDWLNSLKDQK